MRVFVTGAGGFVGRHTVSALRSAGHAVLGLVRHPAEDSDDVTYVTGSVTDDPPEKLAESMADCAAVVHLVGIITEIHSVGQTFERVHVQGTRNVLNAAKRAGITQRFVYISAVGAAQDAPAEYSRTKAVAEEAVQRSGLPFTIFRPSILLGPGAEFLKQVEVLLRKPPLSPIPIPFVPVPGDGQNRFQPLFIEDLTHCIVRALVDESASGQTYVIGGSDEVTFDELIATVGEQIGVRKPLLHVPMPMMFTAAAVLESILPRPPITTDQLLNFGIDNVCDNDPVRKAFDFTPLTFAEALTRSI